MGFTVDLLLITLAGWRFAYLIVNEDGPGNVMGQIRQWAAAEALETHSQDGIEGYKIPDGSLAKLLTCFRCASVWGAALAWLLLKTPLRDIVWIAAGSAAAILVSEYVGVE